MEGVSFGVNGVLIFSRNGQKSRLGISDQR